MKGLFYLVVTMVVIIACTNEEFDANSEVKKEEVKTKIASLAEKYDVNVDFFEINPSEKTENEMSLEEIEEFYEEETWREMCKVLTERERLIGDLFFRQGYKQKELAKIFEVNEARMSQIIRKIRKKLEKFA